MTKLKFTNASNEDDHQWKTTSKYQKWNISVTNDRAYKYFIGNLILKTISEYLKCCITKTHISKEKFIGSLRGNLKCGSAQPSLFFFFSPNVI